MQMNRLSQIRRQCVHELIEPGGKILSDGNFIRRILRRRGRFGNLTNNCLEASKGGTCLEPPEGGIFISQCRPPLGRQSRPPAAVTNHWGATHAACRHGSPDAGRPACRHCELHASTRTVTACHRTRLGSTAGSSGRCRPRRPARLSRRTLIRGPRRRRPIPRRCHPTLTRRASSASRWLGTSRPPFSIVQRKALTPNDFGSLEALGERLEGLARRYREIAQPF